MIPIFKKKHLKIAILLVFQSVITFQANAQLLQKIQNTKLFKWLDASSEQEKRLNLFLSPYVGLSPSTSLVFGFNNSLSYRFDTLSNAKTSLFNLYAEYSLRKQFSTAFTHNIYTKNEGWLLTGKVGYQDFPQSFYAIGNRTPKELKESIHTNNVEFYQKISKKIISKLYIGLIYRYKNVYNVNSMNENSWFEENLPTGYNGFKINGLGINLTFDNRNNVFTPNRGIFLDINYTDYSEKLNSTLPFRNITTDFRWFIKLAYLQELAVRYYSQLSFGQTPWTELPRFGYNGTTRGYLSGRYRADKYYAMETEYRFPLFWKTGMVLFAGMATVAHDTHSEIKFNPNFGFGFRLLVNKSERLYSSADFGFGIQGNYGIYLRLGQAF